MRQLFARWVRDDRGQDLIEYAFLAIFVALAVTVGLQAITDGMNTGFSNLGTQVGGS
jgi:Flp pilus assembly pilin Flp